MAELVDALGLGSSGVSREGSSPFSDIWAISAAVAQLLYTQLVGGSNPSSPILTKRLNAEQCYLQDARCATEN